MHLAGGSRLKVKGSAYVRPITLFLTLALIQDQLITLKKCN